MKLAAGTRLGPYEILAPVGSGGMGEVYRARDTRLERSVAIKILPDHMSSRPEARQRFEREARAVSSLNHARICQLYDIGTQDGVSFFVMELLEGESLADRLRKGPMPLEQVLRRAIEICEGLEAAHRAGVIHRDLKPANIMLTSSGSKLLDFGLAKAEATGSFASSSSALLTRPEPLTTEGVLVGTVPYMSPEQVEGRELDRRTDIFSLGAVLYEMVTGQRAFEGKSPLSIASAILEKEPAPISAVKPLSPPALEHAIRTCLAKDPEQRWQTCRDLAHTLGWIAEGGAHAAAGPATGRRGASRWLVPAALLLTAAAGLLLGWRLAARPVQPSRVSRTHVKPAAGSSLIVAEGAGVALSPDGLSLAFVATHEGTRPLLWIRSIHSLRAEPLPGTEGAKYPFWSPDSRYVGFFSEAKMKKVEAAGGPAFTLCEASDGRGGAWNRHGEILFTPSVNAGLFRVPASGGEPAQVTTTDPAKGELSHRWPVFLPDGRHFLFMAGSVFTPRDNPTNTIMLGSLDAPGTRVLLNSHAGAEFASGNILFLRLNTLMAQPFDTATLQLAGDAIPVANEVFEASLYSKGLFSASQDGLLAYVEGSGLSDRELTWLSRSGGRIGTPSEIDAYASPRISPDGETIVYYIEGARHDVWTYNVTRRIKSPQTFGASLGQSNIFPIWSPDGSRIAYSSYRDGKHSVYQKRADGSAGEEMLLEGSDRYRFLTDWSPDGMTLAYQEATSGGWAVWMLPLTGDRKPYRFLNTRFGEREGDFSPDGKWLAYASNETGEYRVYVTPFPGGGGKWQISTAGGTCPRWRGDGKELFYMAPDNKVMSAELAVRGAGLEVAAVRPLFETRAYGTFGLFDVTPDGQKFLVPYEPEQPSTAIALVANWPADLKH